MSDPAALEVLARRIAEDAHAGQVDKLGYPYIDHVARVAGRLEDPLDRAVAWLHDVVEDTAWRWGDVRSEVSGLEMWPSEMYQAWTDVCADVELLTHRPSEPRADYYARIRTSPRAVRVKLADIADNTDPARMARLDEATRVRLIEKYRRAREALTLSETPARSTT